MAKYRKNDVSMSLQKWWSTLGEQHIAFKIKRFLEGIDLKCFDSFFDNDRYGRSGYPPQNLLNLLIYATFEGVYSNRKIQRYCKENVAYSLLCNGDIPHYSTISRFWGRFRNQIDTLFKSIVKKAKQEGLLNFQHLSGDGVRIQSMGSKSMLFNLENAKKKVASIEKKKSDQKKNLILKKRLIKLIESASKKKKTKNKENKSYFHLTEPDARLIKRSDRFISGYNAQAVVEKNSGFIVSAKVFCNSTDLFNGIPLLNDTILMVGAKSLKGSELTFDNGYENEKFYEKAFESALDLYVPTADPNKSNLKNRKKKETKYPVRYSSKRDAYICYDNHIIKFRRKAQMNNKAYAIYERTCTHCKYAKECIGDRKRLRKRINRHLPQEDDIAAIKEEKNQKMKYRIKMFEKMNDDNSKEIYKQRIATVEPVFAQIEHNRSFRRFTVWGIKKVVTQWKLVCMAFNIFKMI